MPKILSGDYKGTAIWQTTFPWFGKQAKYFKGVMIADPAKGKIYTKDEIVRVKELGAATDFNASQGFGAAVGGAMLAGPVGALAALGARKKSFTYGIEFTDGMKIVVREENPDSYKDFGIFKNYVEQKGLLDIQF
jgi:hypothetical protein